MWDAIKYLGLFGIGAAIFLVSYSYNRRFLDWLRFQSLGTRDYIVDRLAVMFIEVQPHYVLLALFVLSFGLGFLVFILLLPQVFPALLLGGIVMVVGWKAPKPLVDLYYQSRVDKLTVQMVDGLALMSSGMKSGLSVVQAMSLVTQEMPDPIRQEFNLILSENKLGVSLEESFNNLAKRVESEDVQMFVTSVNILKETGGNLAETFDTITETIRARLKVQQKISAMTRQGLVQGVFVLMVPPFMILILSQSDPEFIKPLFTTALGWVMVVLILGLELIGLFVIMKIVKIDV